MRKEEITMKDIAEAMGLSRSTVSRALQDHPHINGETKQLVKEAATKLGYKYNAVAASLRKSKSNIIGLIVPRIDRYYQASVITAIQNQLHQARYNLIICQSNESPELERELVATLYTSRVEGLIVSLTQHTTDLSAFDTFSQNDRPLVFFDRVPRSYPAHKIQGDDYQGGWLATNHLLEQGCRRIAYIGGVQTCNVYKDRFDGYRDALKKYGLPVEEGMVFFHDLTRENALSTCEQLLSRDALPDAVFAGNDTVAVTLVDYAKRRGVKLPEELKVVGYSNDPQTEVINPSITSIEQHPYEVGTRSAALMLDVLQQKTKPGHHFISITIPVALERRESSTRKESQV